MFGHADTTFETDEPVTHGYRLNPYLVALSHQHHLNPVQCNTEHLITLHYNWVPPQFRWGCYSNLATKHMKCLLLIIGHWILNFPHLSHNHQSGKKQPLALHFTSCGRSDGWGAQQCYLCLASLGCAWQTSPVHGGLTCQWSQFLHGSPLELFWQQKSSKGGHNVVLDQCKYKYYRNYFYLCCLSLYCRFQNIFIQDKVLKNKIMIWFETKVWLNLIGTVQFPHKTLEWR